MPTVPTEEIQISQLVSPAEISYSSLASLAIRRRFAGLTRWDIWISSVGTVGISPFSLLTYGLKSIHQNCTYQPIYLFQKYVFMYLHIYLQFHNLFFQVFLFYQSLIYVRI